MGRVGDGLKSRRSAAIEDDDVDVPQPMEDSQAKDHPSGLARWGLGSACEGNQVLFLLLLALVISGAVRVTLEVQGSSPLDAHASLQAPPCPQQQLLTSAHELSTATSVSHSASSLASEALPSTPNPTQDPLSPFFGLRPWALPQSLHQSLFPLGCVLDPSLFQLHIKVLAFDRVDSILRILTSLEAADYSGDAVSLDLFIDHTFSGEAKKWDAQAAQRVELSHALLLRLDAFKWSHGPKRVVYRTQNHGIQPQWLEAWWPETCNDFVLVVEDDMELSPLYYRYFKRLVAHYYYNSTNFEPHVYGISFQRQTFVAGIGGSPMRPAHHPFLYELVGTWGQFLFPLQWRAFRLWYDQRRHNSSREPVLGGLKTTQWWFNKGNRLWTPWIIKWAYSESMFNLYPAFPGDFSLSISHRDKGSNFAKSRGADFQLLGSKIPKRQQDPVRLWWDRPFPAIDQTKRWDLCNHFVAHRSPARRLEEMEPLLEAMNLQTKRVALVIVPPGGFGLVRNWLCHVEGTSLHNFVLVVSNAKDADSLSSIGHMVYHIAGGKGASSAESDVAGASSHSAWTSEHVQLIAETLHLGFDVLINPPHFVWVGNPLASDLASSFDMWGHLEPTCLSDSLLYVHSREKTIAAWNRLHSEWSKAEAQGKSAALIQQASHRWLMGKEASFQQIDGITPKMLKGGMLKVKGSLPIVVLASSKSRQQKLRQLSGSGLWVIDDFDFACKTITCRKGLT